MTFNEWQDHLSKQLELDYKKIYSSPKPNNNARIVQKLSRKKTGNL